MDNDTIQMPEKDNVTVIDGVYVLKRKLGQGGMAAVYLAAVDQLRFNYTSLYAYTQVQGATHLERRQKAEELAGKLSGQTLDPGTVRALLVAQGIPVPGVEVALKVALGEADIARFEVEWKSLLCLNHPNVVQVYGGGKHLGRPYYAMELLDRIVTPGRVKAEFTIAQKLQVVIQAARGLAYLHANGIVHRDVKPDNAVVCETLPGEFVTKITDLGIAKQLELDGMTLAKTAMGTPHYMSPEQFASSKDIDRRADIYSLGATLYELVAGVKPYHNLTTVFEIFRAVTLHTPPLPVAQHNPALPEAITGIIECAMAWDPDCRYQKMEELIKDVEKYLADENVAVTRAVAFSADSKAKSSAHIGKGHYAFERYRRKAAARAQLAQLAPGAAVAGAPAAAGGRPVAATPVRQRRSWRPWLIGASVAALLAVVAGVVIAYQATKRPPHRPAVVVTPALAPLKPPATKPALVAKPPVVPTPVQAPAAVTGADATFIANLHAALKAKNPDYTGKGEFKIEGGKIVEADLRGCKVRDVAPLKGLPLRRLDLWGNSCADISPLEGMPLEHISLSGGINDLRPLAGMRLKTLQMVYGSGKIDSLEPLRGMPLTDLSLDARKDLDLSPLADSQIESLWIRCNEYTPSLAVLRNMPLRTLHLSHGRELPDMAPLSGKTLEGLHVSVFKGHELPPLGNLSCKRIDLDGCPNLVDVAALKNVQALEWLALITTGVTDLSCLAGTKIKILRVTASPIRDLAFARNLPNLESLDVAGCASITDLTPLAGLKLKSLCFTPATVTKGLEAVRGMTTLTVIDYDSLHGYPPAEFWKRYNAGEFGKPGSATVPAPAGLGDQVAVVRGLEKTLAVNLGGGVSMEFVLIRPGSFQMGSENEKPVHTVALTKPFYIGKYEVTQEQWQAVMGANPSPAKGPKLPVTAVNREDCRQFAAKLGEGGRSAAGVFRLPTEAEWEYACRAGTTTAFCFGDSEAALGEYAWFIGNSGGKTHEVGTKKPNAWGLYDMHGNVWEWCSDRFGPYTGETATDPEGPAQGSDGVFRGGSLDYDAGGCRSAVRFRHDPGVRGGNIGCRLVLALPVQQ